METLLGNGWGGLSENRQEEEMGQAEELRNNRMLVSDVLLPPQ
jgi:hypothetical protein